jgi:hypothetical protein
MQVVHVKLSSVAMAKAAFKKKTFHQQMGLKYKAETNEVLHLEHSVVWCRNLDTPESIFLRSEVAGKF